MYPGMNTSLKADYEESAKGYMNIMSGVVLLCIMTLTAVGNLFVMIAYAKDKKLQRNPSNLIILHLSIADFLVGVGSYSFPVAFELSNHEFTLGEVSCKLWMTLDFSCVVMSVAMILCASFDRYWMVTRAIRYSSIQTRGRIKKMIAASWVSVFTVFGVLILGWDALSGLDVPYTDGECIPGHAYSIPVSLLVSSITGYIPLLTIATLNFLIIISLWKRSKLFVEIDLVSFRNQSVLFTIQLRPHESGSDVVGTQSWNSERNVCEQVKRSSGKPKMSQMERRFRRNVRAAVQLVIMVVVFALCWVPFELVTVCSFFSEGCGSELVFRSLSTLQWFNSCINPLIYALTIRRFRKNFKRFLCGGF